MTSDSLFNAAMAAADAAISDTMATVITLFPQQRPTPVRAVVTTQEEAGYATEGQIRLYHSTPVLFVRSADITGLKRNDPLRIDGRDYTVDRLGPDDNGYRHVYLRQGGEP